MKHIKSINSFLNESIESNEYPEFFNSTHYRIPTQEELIDIHKCNLNSTKIIHGFYYNIVGKGIIDNVKKQRISDCITSLCNLDPNNEEYKKAKDSFLKNN